MMILLCCRNIFKDWLAPQKHSNFDLEFGKTVFVVYGLLENQPSPSATIGSAKPCTPAANVGKQPCTEEIQSLSSSKGVKRALFTKLELQKLKG
ncbi:hypothetical protein DVH24_026065 [Malus domestica]|uniref:Uncharacterized protein n=1 Tax=Malus domestica TaxID=3750 RepID=A0A498KFJ1_MALDO|nr:hypothetical protein DVH24_026065 [Malus domestica]